jgi:hypothetical protein
MSNFAPTTRSSARIRVAALEKSGVIIQPIGTLEETSLLALIEYLADERALDAMNVTRGLLDRFNIDTISALPGVEFDAAVRYLVDQIPVVRSTDTPITMNS